MLPGWFGDGTSTEDGPGLKLMVMMLFLEGFPLTYRHLFMAALTSLSNIPEGSTLNN